MPTANSLPETPPKFIACLIDISRYCSPDFVECCGGKVFLSGFFDDSVNTHLCSATPSVFVEALSLEPENYPEGELARDALSERLLELLSPDDDGYYNRRDIERLKVAHPERFKALTHLAFDGEDPSEVAREDLQGNPVF